MKLRTTLLAATALALASTASAANGWYMSLGAGWNWLQDSDYSVGPGGSTYNGNTEFDSGYIIAGAVGYDWGRWRAEFEVAYRDNNIECVAFSSTPGCFPPGSNEGVWELSQMVNVLYDIPLGGRFSASVGAGVGGVLVVADQGIIGSSFASSEPNLDDYVVAGQLIAQVGYDLSDRWQLYADYRYLLADDPEGFSPQAGSPVTWEKSDHSVLIGMRFDLQGERAPMPPKAQPPVQPRSPKQFIVFFGFNKSNLTAEAARVVADAAAAAKEYGSASIMVVGHTDTVGSDRYNNALSMRRSGTVKEALAGHGIPASASLTVPE
ncbi:MAG: OmpA family protein, partial [Alphaproteobacteria bacterium]|nr:OmpA family protein [Alphaproteobacteria bacterium]